MIFNPNGRVDWTFVAGKETAGEGDCSNIAHWAKRYSTADLLEIVYEEGWSGVTLAKSGTAYFKNFGY